VATCDAYSAYNVRKWSEGALPRSGVNWIDGGGGGSVGALTSPWSGDCCASKGAVCGMDACIFAHESVLALSPIVLQSHEISHFSQLSDEDKDSICKGLQDDICLNAVDRFRALFLREHGDVGK